MCSPLKVSIQHSGLPSAPSFIVCSISRSGCHPLCLQLSPTPTNNWASQVALAVRNPPANAGDIRGVGQENPLEEGMATHSSILAWRNPWMEEPGELQSIGLHRVRHD